MHIEKGQNAPAFQTSDLSGQPVVVPSVGKKMWLAFFRYAACPFCHLRIAEIRKNQKQLEEAGIEVIAIAQSPKKNIEAYMQINAPGLRFVADPEGVLYKLYQLKKSLAGTLSPKNLPYARQIKEWTFHPESGWTRMPADFLIDEQGRLADVFYASIAAEHISWESVWEFSRR